MLLRRSIQACLETGKPATRKFIAGTPPSLSYSDIPGKKPKIAPLQERKMIDRIKLWAKGGEGGNGCASFRRSRHDRRGIPDGGNGGRGGDVILECSAAVWDFSNLQHHLKAKRGGNGLPKNKVGSRGADKVALVPVGTVIHLVEGDHPRVVEKSSNLVLDPWDIPGTVETNPADSDTSNISSQEVIGIKAEHFNKNLSFVERDLEKSSMQSEVLQSSTGNHTSQFSQVESTNAKEDSISSEKETDSGDENMGVFVAELTEPGKRLLVALGGEGSLGSASTGKDPKRHKHMGHKNNPSDRDTSDDENESSVTSGQPGTEAVLILELKSIADVGLVGMPNAGKSTILGAISRAKPVVGDYAFTTLRPNIGNLNYEDFFSVTVADIPGLIKGAHENRGLGHAFLRHIERTKVVAYVVDLAATLGGRKDSPPWEQLRDLVLELEQHQEGLANKPSLIVANKIDEDGAEDVLEELKRRVPGVPIYPISAILEEGIPELKAGLRKLIDGVDSRRLTLDGIMLD